MKLHFFILLLLGFTQTKSKAQLLIAEPLKEPINSKYDELTPIILADGKTMFFTRGGSPDFDHTLMHAGQNLYETMDYEDYKNTLSQAFQDISGTWVGDVYQSPANQDIWFAQLDANTTKHLKHPINNALPNSILSSTPDPNIFYVVNRLDPQGTIAKGISYIERLGDGWSFPSPVEIEDFYTVTAEVSIAMSFEGNYMLLSAKRNDSQDLDLYLCKKKGEHKWSIPERLGSAINSPFRELAPSLSDDGKTLYFTSNRDGDHNVYFSHRLDETWLVWSTPTKMESPINSAYDDSQPSFNTTTGDLYFTSKRNGDSDIFKAHIAPPQPSYVTIQGRVLNERSGVLLKKSTIYYTPEGGEMKSVYAEDGNFKLQIPRGRKYEIKAEKAGYTDSRTEVHFKKEARIFHGHYILDLSLAPYGVNEQIVLNPFYFRQSKAELLEVSFSEIERLSTILKENPSMEIRIEGHTDNLGKTSDLQRLSTDRAETIKQALVEKGITASRLTTIGYGGTRPFTSNESDDERKKNRRVEVIITKI